MDGDISASIVDSSYGFWDRYKRSSESVKLTINGNEYRIRLYTDDEMESKGKGKMLDISEIGGVLRHAPVVSDTLTNHVDRRKYTHLNAKDFKRVEKVLRKQFHIGKKEERVRHVVLETLKLDFLAQGSYNSVFKASNVKVLEGLAGKTEKLAARVQALGDELIFRSSNLLSGGQTEERIWHKVEQQEKNEKRIIGIATWGLSKEQCYRRGVEPPGVEVIYQGRTGTLKERFADSLRLALEAGERPSVTKQRFSSIVEGASFLFNRGIALLDVKCANMLVKEVEGKNITVHTDLGESTIEDLYKKMSELGPVKLEQAASPLFEIKESQTPYLMNSKFEGRLVGTIKIKIKKLLKKCWNSM